MTYEAMNVGYVELSPAVSLTLIDGEVRRPMRVAPKVWAKALKDAAKKAKAKVAKPKKTAEELKASRAAALEKARATRAAKPKVAKPKVAKPLSDAAAAMLNELRRIADVEGNIAVASIALAGVSGRTIGALLSVLARRSLYVKGVKGAGRVVLA